MRRVNYNQSLWTLMGLGLASARPHKYLNDNLIDITSNVRTNILHVVIVSVLLGHIYSPLITQVNADVSPHKMK